MEAKALYRAYTWSFLESRRIFQYLDANQSSWMGNVHTEVRAFYTEICMQCKPIVAKACSVCSAAAMMQEC